MEAVNFNYNSKTSCSNEGFSSKFPQEERVIRNLEKLLLNRYEEVDPRATQNMYREMNH